MEKTLVIVNDCEVMEFSSFEQAIIEAKLLEKQGYTTVVELWYGDELLSRM